MSEIDWEQRIREGIEAYNRGDWEAVLADASEDIELKRADISPEARDVVRGRERVLDYFRPDVFQDQRIEIREIEIGEDAVYVRMNFSARGAGSGIPMELESHTVYRIVDDLLVRLEIYADAPDARAAAGLG
jgi:ketosteroid isomerase-like protein